MRILNFGSINLDHCYKVPHFVQAGQTLASFGLQVFIGGKGLNQSVAIARAGAKVSHAGAVGRDGGMALSLLQQEGVDISLIRTVSVPTGHAIIQIVPEGENAILLYGGANQVQTPEQIETALRGFSAGDLLVLQNEINSLDVLINTAHAQGMRLFFNPAPMAPTVRSLPLQKIECLIVNQTEAAALAGQATLPALIAAYPGTHILLTLGKKGAQYFDGHTTHTQPAFPVKAVDTTAAGDTFIGYFVAGIAQGLSPGELLCRAAKAAAISVTRPGAAPSIPYLSEVETFSF